MNNLVKENLCLLPRTIPKSARIYLCGIESEVIRKSTSFKREFKINSKILQLKIFSIDNANKFDNESDNEYEPYTTENLNKIDFEILTEIIQIDEFKIEFDNFDFLRKLCEKNESLTLQKSLKCSKDGKLDALVIWFDLILDEEIIITNSPINKNSSQCWQQAIYSIPNDLNISKGSQIDVEVKLRQDCILVRPILSGNNENSDSSKEICLHLLRSQINVLNNQSYQQFYTKFFSDLMTNLPENSSNLKIGFYSANLNILFLDLFFKLKSEMKEKIKSKVEICFILNTNENNCFKNLLEKNFKRLKIIYLDKLINSEEVNIKGISNPIFDFDYLVCEPVDVEYGTLRKNFLNDIMLIKSLNKKTCNSIFIYIF